jgi:hypothetical protein
MTSKTISIHPCDDTAQVVTVKRPPEAKPTWRKTPCAECPWRKDRPVGAFPVEAYRHSARTAYDMSSSVFSCHMSGSDKPQFCAGALLSTGAAHNMSLRLHAMWGHDWTDITSDVALYGSYREMAEANGVDKSDPCLKGCR